MTATQAPTPGPLDSESVKLLVKGDLLLCKTWGVVRFDRFDDSGVRAFVLDLANDQVRLMKPINMAFIGRPDADGWMPGEVVTALLEAAGFYEAAGLPITAERLRGLAERHSAHPSPTPAADADNLTKAVSLLERWDWSRSEMSGKGTVETDTREFIAALKSTAAKEGGEHDRL